MATKNEKKLEAAHVVSPYALIFELEGALTGGRRLLFDTLKKLLKKEKLNLDEATFIRHAIGPAPVDAVPALIEALDGEGVSDDKMQAALVDALQTNGAELGLTPILRKLIDAATKHGVPLVAASCLPTEAAEALLEKSGLAELGIKLHAVAGAEACCPCKQDWQELCRGLSRVPHRCFALVSTAAACHAALSVDLRVIAVCDEFTTAQDFGGAEVVYETPADLDLADLLARMPVV
jgi:beta-phosphoglucomutase-like phosphatase (HAD superfamily)